MELPDEPSALKSALLDFWFDDQTSVDLPAEDIPTEDEWLWPTGLDILRQLPITPATRAAFHRMLTDLSSTRVVRRSGKVTISRPFQYGYLGGRVTFDSATGELSAIEYVLLQPDSTQRGGAADFSGLPKGTVISRTVFTKAGWTDETPRLPKGCTLREDQGCLR
jgi:hypothetical protein